MGKRILTLLFAFLSFHLYCQPGNLKNVGIGEISVIEMAPHGSVWTGTMGQGLSLLTSGSQNPVYFTSANTPQFRSDSITSAVSKTMGGLTYVFAGSTNGLVRYNGAVWDTVGPLPDNHVTGLLITANDTLWVFTQSNGVALFDSLGQTYLGTLNTGNSNLPSDSAVGAQKGDLGCGSFCFLAKDKGCVYTKNSVNFTVIDTAASSKQLIDNRVDAAYIQNDCAARLVATQGGFSICPPGLKCINYTTANGLSENYITAVAQDCQSNIWLGTRDSGIMEFTPHANTHTAAFVLDTTTANLSSTVLGPTGYYYGVDTVIGNPLAWYIYQINPTNGSYSVVYNATDTTQGYYPQTPFNNSVILIDSNLYGNLLRGCTGGYGGRYKYNVYTNAYTLLQSGASSIFQQANFQDLSYQNGLIWGAGNSYVWWFSVAVDTLDGVRLINWGVPAVPSSCYAINPSSICIGSDSMVYFTGEDTHGDDLFRILPGNDTVERLPAFIPAVGAHVSTLMGSQNGSLYGVLVDSPATGAKLFAYNINAGTYSVLSSITDIDFTYGNGQLIQSKNGLVYFVYSNASQNDIALAYNPYDNTSTTVTVPGTLGYAPVSIGEAGNGLIYVQNANSGSGSQVYSFNPEATKLKTLTTADGLPSNNISFIAFNTDSCSGNGWVGTSDGQLLQIDTAGHVLQVIASISMIADPKGTVKVYPQPATTELEFVFNNTQSHSSLTVFDCLGRVVKQYTVNNTSLLSIDVSSFAPGIYGYSFVNGNEAVSSGKFIVYR